MASSQLPRLWTDKEILQEVLEEVEDDPMQGPPENSKTSKFIVIARGKEEQNTSFTEQDAAAMMHELRTLLDSNLECDPTYLCLILRCIKSLGMEVEYKHLPALIRITPRYTFAENFDPSEDEMFCQMIGSLLPLAITAYTMEQHIQTATLRVLKEQLLNLNVHLDEVAKEKFQHLAQQEQEVMHDLMLRFGTEGLLLGAAEVRHMKMHCGNDVFDRIIKKLKKDE